MPCKKHQSALGLGGEIEATPPVCPCWKCLPPFGPVRLYQTRPGLIWIRIQFSPQSKPRKKTRLICFFSSFKPSMVCSPKAWIVFLLLYSWIVTLARLFWNKSNSPHATELSAPPHVSYTALPPPPPAPTATSFSQLPPLPQSSSPCSSSAASSCLMSSVDAASRLPLIHQIHSQLRSDIGYR
jgi:hypothetical protein